MNFFQRLFRDPRETTIDENIERIRKESVLSSQRQLADMIADDKKWNIATAIILSQAIKDDMKQNNESRRVISESHYLELQNDLMRVEKLIKFKDGSIAS